MTAVLTVSPAVGGCARCGRQMGFNRLHGLAPVASALPSRHWTADNTFPDNSSRVLRTHDHSAVITQSLSL